jgi:hypothetical protein
MTDPSTDREMLANERRKDAIEGDDREPSVAGVVEDAVSTFAKPLSNRRPSAEDAERQREANDAEQRG